MLFLSRPHHDYKVTMKDKILEFINANWVNTIVKDNKELPCPYNSPNTGIYSDFYYWDLYFINKGLLLSKMPEQAENNIKNMVYFVNTLGYVPNSNLGDMRNRTQPPVLTRCVWDLYQYTQDKNIISKYIDALIKEHNFFQTRRMTKIGLNAYMCDDKTNTYEQIMNHYKYLANRVYEYSDNPTTQYEIGRDIIAVAESGLDFNARFKTKDRLMAASEFAHLDLNCWLFAVEMRLSEMLNIINRQNKSQEFLSLANKRKALIDKYFFDEKQGIYVDYHLSDGKHSHVITAVSLYPYAMGISKDKKPALKVFKQLELEHGVSTAAHRKETQFYQWDYPVMWGETTFIIFLAMLNVGAIEEAKRTMDKYMSTIEKQFKETGLLWEKYDARDGSIMNVEYDAPPFMGWTASTYEIFATQGIDISIPYIKII